MKISVIIPVFNEETTIKALIDKVLKTGVANEIIIVDDGSADGTKEILKRVKNGDSLQVITHEKNKGKGAALRTGLKHITGDIIIFQDADLEYDPAEYEELLKPIQDGVADVVYGSRLRGGKPQRAYLFWHKLGNDFLTFLTNILFNTTISDMETGYKVFHKKAIDSIILKCNGFSIEPEITAKVLKNKTNRIYEIPISYYGRTYREGKKITWRQGFSAIFALIWFRFFD